MKIYFYDVGLRNALLNDFTPLAEHSNNARALWESFFFMERYKRHVCDQDFTRMYFSHDADILEVKDGHLKETFAVDSNKDEESMATKFVGSCDDTPLFDVNLENAFGYWAKPAS